MAQMLPAWRVPPALFRAGNRHKFLLLARPFWRHHDAANFQLLQQYLWNFVTSACDYDCRMVPLQASHCRHPLPIGNV